MYKQGKLKCFEPNGRKYIKKKRVSSVILIILIIILITQIIEKISKMCLAFFFNKTVGLIIILGFYIVVYNSR